MSESISTEHTLPARSLKDLIKQRILILDGAYGTAFQNRNLSEEQGFPRRILMGVLVLLGCIVILLVRLD